MPGGLSTREAGSPEGAPGGTALLARRIRAESRRLGFARVGFSAAGESDAAGRLQAWLREGFQGEMGYMERDPETRSDPRRLFPEARSVVSAALSYHCEEPEASGPGEGVISRYAWGGDYHDLMRVRLEALLDFIRRIAPGARGKVCVDHSAVLEKAWAARGGVGWQGKHSNTIVKEAGCWTFLGEILLSIEIEADAPARDHCGTCTRCLEACPTGAIVEPYRVDARKCISYLNIELRGPIPAPLRPALGNRIFGCDDCLDVCPWNRFEKPTPDPGLHPHPANRRARLADLARLDRAQFRARFRRTPVWRARFEGFLRNVAVALGNWGSVEAIPSLEHLLANESPLVRGHAAWGLGRVGGREALGVLRRALEREADPEPRAEIGAALAAAAGTPAGPNRPPAAGL